MGGSPFVTGINQIAITCHDVPRAATFYRDVVGIPFLFESNGLAFLQCGDTRLMLSKPEGEGSGHGNSIIYFKTDDIVAATSSLVAHGVMIDEQPTMVARLPTAEVWVSAWRDSEGNMMAFQQEKPIA